MERSLILVISDHKTKVAQYCYKNGGPFDQGVGVLTFLRRTRLKPFKQKVDALGVTSKGDDSVCCSVLYGIAEGRVTRVKLDEDFAMNPVFCSWLYTIDLTIGTFSVKKLDGPTKTYRVDALPTEREFLDEVKDF